MWAPFFGHLLLKLDPIIARPEHGVPTAAVSRDRRLYLNYGFCDKLTDGEFLFLMCHEVMHPAYQCFPRGESRKAIVFQQVFCGGCGGRKQVIFADQPAAGPQDCPVCQATGKQWKPVSVWNLAHDFAINDIIDQMINTDDLPMKMPEGGLLDKKYRDMSAEEIYDLLLDQAEENSKNGDGQGEGQPGEPGQGGQGPSLPGMPQDMWGDDIRPDLGGDGPEGGEPGETESGTGNKSDCEKQELDDYWKVAVVEAAQVHEQQNRGHLPAGLRKLIDEIVDPKIAWADILSRWVGENGRRADYTYRRPSRRSESVGEYLPSMQRYGVDDIIVLWDTSGSMGGREVEIMSEVIGICEDLSLKLRVICCDMQVASDNIDVEYPEDVDWAGGGGSDFCPAFELMDEEGYEGVVVAFTDGYIGVPTVKPPNIRSVLWVLWERDQDPTHGAWGEVIRVDTDGNVV
jgi:predicted metal-dependent peptidase